MDITRQLAEHVHRVKFNDLPRDVVEKGKQCFLDCMGSALGGLRDEASEIIKDYVQTFGGEGKSTIIGTRMRRDMAHAALANGVIAHALDFDDYHSETVIHGTAACLPALLAVAENDGLTGQDLLTALSVGFDVSIRVGMALGSYHYERGWHSTSTSGIFGATAGVAKLMNLEPHQIVHAFGLCGTQASGLRQVFGTMTKPFHPGKAAMDALISCALARKGFTCSENILEGEMGVLEVLTENPRGELILEGLGSKYHILDVSFKPYPTCAWTHSTIGLLEEIKAAHNPTIERVKKIGIETGPVAFSSAGIRRPKIGVEGKFSLWFLAALALAEGSVTLEKFTDEKVKDPALVRLMERIDAQLVRELKFGARVLVRMEDGTEYRGHRKIPKGDPENPLSFEELASKFIHLARMAIPEHNAARLVERIQQLEEVRDLGEIMALTAP